MRDRHRLSREPLRLCRQVADRLEAFRGQPQRLAPLFDGGMRLGRIGLVHHQEPGLRQHAVRKLRLVRRHDVVRRRLRDHDLLKLLAVKRVEERARQVLLAGQRAQHARSAELALGRVRTKERRRGR